MSGKNLLTYPYTYKTKTVKGITFTDTGDGTITINGTADGEASCYMKSPSDVPLFKLPIGEYVYTCEGVKDDASYYSNIYYYDNKGFRNLMCTVTKDSPNGIISITNEIFENYQAILLEIVVKNGVTVSKVVLKPMITLASETDDTYEPYCGGIASPNPDYPQEIKGLGDGGTIEVKTCGKNLLKNTATTKTMGGVTFTVNEDKTITLNGTATTDLNYVFNWNIDATKKSVLASIHKISGSASSDSNISFFAFDSRWWGAYGPTINSVERKLNNYDFIIFRIQVKKDTVCTNLKVGLMVRYETVTDGTYEPYTETQALIPISTPLYDGDYIEAFADGSGQIVRTMGSIVYDGSSDEGWYQETTRFYTAKIADAVQCDTSKSGKKAYANQLRLVNTGETSNAQNDNSFTIASTKNLYLRINSITDISSLRTHLSINPLHVVYTLATPTTEPLTASQVAEFMKLQTFKGVTHVTAGGEVTVRYYCDADNGEDVAMLLRKLYAAENKANNLEARVAELEVAIAALG